MCARGEPRTRAEGMWHLRFFQLGLRLPRVPEREKETPGVWGTEYLCSCLQHYDFQPPVSRTAWSRARSGMCRRGFDRPDSGGIRESQRDGVALEEREDAGIQGQHQCLVISWGRGRFSSTCQCFPLGRQKCWIFWLWCPFWRWGLCPVLQRRRSHARAASPFSLLSLLFRLRSVRLCFRQGKK